MYQTAPVHLCSPWFPHHQLMWQWGCPPGYLKGQLPSPQALTIPVLGLPRLWFNLYITPFQLLSPARSGARGESKSACWKLLGDAGDSASGSYPSLVFLSIHAVHSPWSCEHFFSSVAIVAMLVCRRDYKPSTSCSHWPQKPCTSGRNLLQVLRPRVAEPML